MRIIKRSSNRYVQAILIASMLLCFSISFITGCSSSNSVPTNTVPTETKASSETTTKTDISKTPAVSGNLKVHYINVGQGDSILIQQGSQNMLIDTGTNASTSSLMSYLQKQNIKKIDVLVLTHPHEDHIGGADAVIKGFDIGTIYMPKVTDTTKIYKDVISAIASKNLKITTPVPGNTFKIGNAGCTILGPIRSNSKDLNTYSIVIKLVYGNNKFLFTGDAQASNEEDMINAGYDLSADVLKVGHHGSDTSTCAAFLSKVNPKYAVISCGVNNDYGHPHKSTMDRLHAKGIPVYRTDECGTIVCTSDGTNIKFNVNVGDYKEGVKGSSSSSDKTSNTPAVASASAATSSSTQDQNVIVYVTTSGKKYHEENCSTLAKSKTKKAITLEEAKKEGYTPCKVCNPPQ